MDVLCLHLYLADSLLVLRHQPMSVERALQGHHDLMGASQSLRRQQRCIPTLAALGETLNPQ